VQIVFSQFKTALSEFEKRLTAAGVRVARFDGDTPDKLRLEIKHNLEPRQRRDAEVGRGAGQLQDGRHRAHLHGCHGHTHPR
jgi:predicted component of type VI protein secretion system